MLTNKVNKSQTYIVTHTNTHTLLNNLASGWSVVDSVHVPVALQLSPVRVCFARGHYSTAHSFSMLSFGLLTQIHGRTQVGMQCTAPKLQFTWEYMPGISHGNLSDA